MFGRGWLQVPQRSWKEKERLPVNTDQPNTTDIEDGEDNEGPPRPGEFDKDEPEEVLWRVKASKSSGSRVQASASGGSLTGSGSGSRPTGSGSVSRSTTPAISQWGGPPVARKTEEVGIELLRLVHDQ